MILNTIIKMFNFFEKKTKNLITKILNSNFFCNLPTEEKNAHLTIKTVTTSETPEDGYALGDTITFGITTTNDGNLTITNVKVTDELTGDEWTIEKLVPGETKEFETSYVVTEADILKGELANKAKVSGATLSNE